MTMYGFSAPFFLMLLMVGHEVTALSCNFDHGYCGWKQSWNNQFDWRIGKEATSDATSGPKEDHTSGRGQYVYIRGKDAHDADAHASLVSPFLSVTSIITFKFWYHMNGNGIGTLSLSMLPASGGRRLLWRLSRRQGNEWKLAQVKLPPGLYQVELDATALLHVGSDIAVDDIDVTHEPAEVTGITRPTTTTTTTTTTTAPTTTLSTTPRPTLDLSCAFEKDWCVWKQDSLDNYDWRRNKGLSDDRSSGPSGDHTTGNGYYVYMRGADSSHPGEYTRLTTPFIEAYIPSNMTFWYHMNGAGIGTLKVLRLGLDHSTTELFSASGRQGPEWHQAHVNILPGTFRIVIEATTKLHYGSDIAIDDIIASVFEVFPMTTTPTPTTTTPTPPTTEPKPITCTFETGMCGWSQYKGDNIDWTRWTGATPDFVSGPTNDHTTAHGYFMFLDGRYVENSNWTADLITHDLDIKTTSSLTFWYYMNGANIGSLRVQKLTSDGTVTTLWRRDGRQAPDWLEGHVALSVGTYRLAMSATALHHYGSDLAIDDVTLKTSDAPDPLVG
ncbi:MAM and LDL-receptor class A domain-containing protein 1-like isoform X1 [Haliotis rufescens]|uniref:MAM and LDL-receptor class A domain-containing protein 1-like isoform X1 n=1 Tax=Haliotis rufescens TaxID=6454 RepID=UPI001EB06965|nr:MAM and LDL-receptor class A domain-containing protein 1-like isoform X1 [Haliotis rufescens]